MTFTKEDVIRLIGVAMKESPYKIGMRHFWPDKKLTENQIRTKRIEQCQKIITDAGYKIDDFSEIVGIPMSETEYEDYQFENLLKRQREDSCLKIEPTVPPERG